MLQGRARFLDRDNKAFRDLAFAAHDEACRSRPARRMRTWTDPSSRRCARKFGERDEIRTRRVFLRAMPRIIIAPSRARASAPGRVRTRIRPREIRQIKQHTEENDLRQKISRRKIGQGMKIRRDQARTPTAFA